MKISDLISRWLVDICRNVYGVTGVRSTFAAFAEKMRD